MSIVLIGYRGSGKTTVGRQLASELGWGFADLDEMIVRQAGKTIKEIFEQQGEPVFRELESQCLVKLLQLVDHVISLGGGSVLAEQNRQAIQTSGYPVIYLKSDAKSLHERIVTDPQTMLHRPGLTHLGGSVEEVRVLLAQREPLYQAIQTLVVDATGTPDEIVKNIRQQIG